MLEGSARPVERPMDERRRHEHDGHVRQDDAPVRENPLVEMARDETGEPVGVVIGRHNLDAMSECI